jgi:hypothetical protein
LIVDRDTKYSVESRSPVFGAAAGNGEAERLAGDLWSGDVLFELFADSRSRDMSRQVHRVVE